MKSVQQNKRKKGTRSSQKETWSSREGGKSVRTFIHARHFPDLPGREITIEGTSIFKHCTTPATNKSPRIKKWVEKKGGKGIDIK
jgi:hypothetical protein